MASETEETVIYLKNYFRCGADRELKCLACDREQSGGIMGNRKTSFWVERRRISEITEQHNMGV